MVILAVLVSDIVAMISTLPRVTIPSVTSPGSPVEALPGFDVGYFKKTNQTECFKASSGNIQEQTVANHNPI